MENHETDCNSRILREFLQRLKDKIVCLHMEKVKKAKNYLTIHLQIGKKLQSALNQLFCEQFPRLKLYSSYDFVNYTTF